MRLLAMLSVVTMSACSTVTSMDGRDISQDNVPSSCNARIWQTYQSAIEQGPISELCVITGQSSFTFSHTVATAIEQNKARICACGAREAYIQSRGEITAFSGPATVTLVAFRRTKTKSPSE